MRVIRWTSLVIGILLTVCGLYVGSSATIFVLLSFMGHTHISDSDSQVATAMLLIGSIFFLISGVFLIVNNIRKRPYKLALAFILVTFALLNLVSFYFIEYWFWPSMYIPFSFPLMSGIFLLVNNIRKRPWARGEAFFRGVIFTLLTLGVVCMLFSSLWRFGIPAELFQGMAFWCASLASCFLAELFHGMAFRCALAGCFLIFLFIANAWRAFRTALGRTKVESE